MEEQRVQVQVVEELVQLVKAIQYLLEAMVFKATLLAHRFIEVAVVGLVGLEKSELVGLVVAELVQYLLMVALELSILAEVVVEFLKTDTPVALVVLELLFLDTLRALQSQSGQDLQELQQQLEPTRSQQ
jgi:hypothetical protein